MSKSKPPTLGEVAAALRKPVVAALARGTRVSVLPGKLILAVTKRTLVGRTIVGFEQRPFSNGRGGYTTNPVIRLDDGTELTFDVDETEQLEYGVRIRRWRSAK
jgi:hypothetical protein